VIEFDRAESVDKNGWNHLMRHTANAYGEAKTSAEKIDFAESNAHEYIDIALNSIERIEDWKKADKPFCFLRSCIEIMDVTTPWLKGISDSNDPDQLKHYSGQTTVPKAKKWFRRIASGYSVLELKEVGEMVYDRFMEKYENDFYLAPDNLHYLSHLPCEIDQSNSAFQHISQMMDRRDVFEKVLGADVYSDVAEKLPEELFSGLEDEGDKRKLVKLVAVPWSYGAGIRTIDKRVKKYRRENPDKIKHLEGLDDPAIRELCVLVIDQLNAEYPVCGEYQQAVKDAVDEVKNRGQHDYVEWDTPFEFIARQRVHDTIHGKKKDRVYCGPEYSQKTGKQTKDGKDEEIKQGGDREVRATLPTYEIDWDEMRTKAPPNLVHSYDSALAHGTLWATGRFYQTVETPVAGQSPLLWSFTGLKVNEVHPDSHRIMSRNPIAGNPRFNPDPDNPDPGDSDPVHMTPEDGSDWGFPVVTIHDAYSCLASHCDEVISALQHNFEQMYQRFDPLQRFLNSVKSGTYPLRHRNYRWIPSPDQFS